MATRLPRAVKLFGAVSLFNDFASEMVYPLLPAFITSVLGAGPLALGALDGVADLAASGIKLVSGRLADRRGRRGPLVIMGYAAAVAVRPLIAVTGAAWQVIGLRVVDRLGKGLRTPPRDAIIADVTPPAHRGRAFGMQRGLDHTGAVLGPLTAWWLLTSGAAPLRHVIAASIVPGVVVLVLAVLAVRNSERPFTSDRSPEGAAAAAGRGVVLPPAVLAVAGFYLLRMPETLIILRAQQLGVAVAVIPLLWAGLHVVRSSTSFVGGALSDRIGPRRAMYLGWAAYAVIATGFALAQRTAHAWILFLILGVVAGLTESPERALVASAAGPRQGSGFGAYHAVTGAAALGGGLALGWLYQQWGGAAAFAVSAAAAAALALGAAALRRPVRSP